MNTITYQVFTFKFVLIKGKLLQFPWKLEGSEYRVLARERYQGGGGEGSVGVDTTPRVTETVLTPGNGALLTPAPAQSGLINRLVTPVILIFILILILILHNTNIRMGIIVWWIRSYWWLWTVAVESLEWDNLGLAAWYSPGETRQTHLWWWGVGITAPLSSNILITS